MQRTSKTQRTLQAVARWLCVGGVSLSPWLYGSADPWAYLIVCGLIDSALIVWLFSAFTAPSLSFRYPVLAAALAALVAFVLLQMVPLPAGLVRLLNPFTARHMDAARSILSEIEAGLFLPKRLAPAEMAFTLSVSPAATRRALYLLVSYVAAFIVLLNTCRHWHQVKHAAAAIVAVGFVMTVLGLVHKFTGSREIFWFHTPRHGGSIFGPFTNRNHFAAYANMLLGLALGLFLSSRDLLDVFASGDWRERVACLSSRRASQMALSLFAVALFAGGVFVSMSRGAILSLAVALGAGGALLAFRRGADLRVRRFLLAGALLVIGLAAWLGGWEVVDRLRSLSEVVRNPMEDYRTIVGLDTLRILAACPAFGCGFGGFRHVFSLFQTPSLQYRWLHAHNDWAQLLAEGGTIGLLLFLAAAGIWIFYIRREFASARRRPRLFVFGVWIGLATIAVHSVFDYSLHKPATAWLLVSLCGLGGAAALLKYEDLERLEAERRERAQRTGGGLNGWRLQAVRGTVLAALLAMVLLVARQYREFRGELAFARFLYLKRVIESTDNVREKQKSVVGSFSEADLAMRWADGNADAMTEMSGALMLWVFLDELPREVRVRCAEKAAETSAMAVMRAPADYLTWLSLARTQTTMARWDEAELCLIRARSLTRHSREVRMFQVIEAEEAERVP